MNTIENYIFHLQQFKSSDLIFIREAVEEVTNLTLPSETFINDVRLILKNAKLSIPDTLSEQEQIEVGQVLYILARLIQYYDQTYNSYKESRLAAYPPIGDQLDALFHAGVFPPEMAAKIQEVKNKYPKPQ